MNKNQPDQLRKKTRTSKKAVQMAMVDQPEGIVMAKAHAASLKDILRDVSSGTTQIPEFQRDRAWDGERIRAVAAGVACSR